MPDEQSMIEDLRELEEELRQQGEYRKANIIDLFIIHSTHCKISKETIQKYLENEKELFETYKKESRTNENLKMGLYKHMGAKNMCERILGIEKTVTLD